MILMTVTCEICGRELGTKLISEHHLIPKTHGGKQKILLHNICHQKIHSVYTEKQLQKYFHTPSRILESEEIQKFVKWIQKKPVDYYDKSDETTTRYSKRRK